MAEGTLWFLDLQTDDIRSGPIAGSPSIEGCMNALAFGPDDTTMVIGLDDGVQIVDLEEGFQVGRLIA